ncbi:MAG: hypothetical protein R2856_15355 [Caldilineaceae bacterium]
MSHALAGLGLQVIQDRAGLPCPHRARTCPSSYRGRGYAPLDADRQFAHAGAGRPAIAIVAVVARFTTGESPTRPGYFQARPLVLTADARLPWLSSAMKLTVP